ncbi:TPA: hypothetical protein ACH3X2_005406 [Trebouxia sp. C0005]
MPGHIDASIHFLQDMIFRLSDMLIDLFADVKEWCFTRAYHGKYYPSDIQNYRLTDGYSTGPKECFNKLIRAAAARTNFKPQTLNKQVADNLTLQEAALQQIRATKATMPLGPRHGMGARQKALKSYRTGVEGRPAFRLHYGQSQSTESGSVRKISNSCKEIPSLKHFASALCTWAGANGFDIEEEEVDVVRTLGIYKSTTGTADVVRGYLGLVGNQRHFATYRGQKELLLPDVELEGREPISKVYMNLNVDVEVPVTWWAQVHMVFRVLVSEHGKPRSTQRKDFLFVRFYASPETHDPRQDLGVRHLVWDQMTHKSPGRKTQFVTHYAVV